LSLTEAAATLGISYRQARRIKARYTASGDCGLMHKLRGRASNNKRDADARAAVLKIYRARYAGFGPTLACEHLLADGHDVSHDALGRWLREEGLFEKRRKRGGHRLRRPRRSCFGELAQMDGSWHDWLEGRGPWCCLMVIIDDATGRVLARFYEKETLSAAFDLFGRYARSHGLPQAVYVDKAGIYRAEEGMPPTQFGRAMQDLGVELILANSPQAKGRVERMNGTLQDRLVKEMRLREVKDMASANAFLDQTFLAAFNGKFAVTAAKKKDVHRSVRKSERLEEVLCERHERAVGQDWCVQWRGRFLQIDAGHAGLDLPRLKRRVMVIELAGGQLILRHAGVDLQWLECTSRPTCAKPARKPIKNNASCVPGPTHPYRRTTLSASALRGLGLVGSASKAQPPKPC